MTYLISLLVALSLLVTGSPAPASQPSTEAHTVATQTHTEVSSDLATEDTTDPAVNSVAQGKRWAGVMLAYAGIDLKANVQLIFSNTSNCGADISTVHLGGCTYNLGDGNYAVVISPELAWTKVGNHILFHELGHTVGLDECGAEAFAHQYEEVALWSYPNCETTGKP
jgi:hypothetical protein